MVVQTDKKNKKKTNKKPDSTWLSRFDLSPGYHIPALPILTASQASLPFREAVKNPLGVWGRGKLVASAPSYKTTKPQARALQAVRFVAWHLKKTTPTTTQPKKKPKNTQTQTKKRNTRLVG